MKKQILATGLSGLVGTRLAELLTEEYAFQDLSLATGVDITNYEKLNKALKNTQAKVLIHLAAKTDVDACEDDKIFGEEGAAWRVNVIGTENVVKICEEKGIRLIYISTDFVFDGSKDYYTEKDSPNPVNWYGFTKYLGEKVVLESDVASTVVRIAYPYRASYSFKKDFVRRILEKIENEETILGIADHIITPTFIDDIASVFKKILAKDLPGIFHVVGSSHLSVYEAIETISQIFCKKAKITKIKRRDYFKDRAFRPFKLRLKNDKIAKLGLNMLRFDKGLLSVKKQRQALRKK